MKNISNLIMVITCTILWVVITLALCSLEIPMWVKLIQCGVGILVYLAWKYYFKLILLNSKK
ncbi:hypothetical protein ES703_82273 [subsurface metagenome]